MPGPSLRPQAFCSGFMASSMSAVGCDPRDVDRHSDGRGVAESLRMSVVGCDSRPTVGCYNL